MIAHDTHRDSNRAHEKNEKIKVRRQEREREREYKTQHIAKFCRVFYVQPVYVCICICLKKE